MALFPSVWDLLIPNWSITTAIGFLLIIVGVLAFVFLKQVEKVFPNFKISIIGLLLILIGLFLVWGMSMFYDFITTPGGIVVTILLAVLALGFLIYSMKKGKGKGGVF